VSSSQRNCNYSNTNPYKKMQFSSASASLRVSLGLTMRTGLPNEHLVPGSSHNPIVYFKIPDLMWVLASHVGKSLPFEFWEVSCHLGGVTSHPPAGYN
jgi:hypothetical protein